VFEGIRGSGYRGDIAIDDVKMASGPCSTIGTCNFEKNLCGWTQRQDDMFDWLRRRGSTPSAGTGPTSDHTLGTSTGIFLIFKCIYAFSVFCFCFCFLICIISFYIQLKDCLSDHSFFCKFYY
jgi:hypothetical protein